jgi:hypothetical protein
MRPISVTVDIKRNRTYAGYSEARGAVITIVLDCNNEEAELCYDMVSQWLCRAEAEDERMARTVQRTKV